MSAATASTAAPSRRISLAWAARQRVVIALILLILFGALRYDHFLGAYNVLSVLRYNSKFALTSLGMCFVIIGAGIDLSVGTTAAFASVVSALLSPYRLLPGLLGGLAAGFVVGAINGFMVTRMNIQPFIATLSGMLAASGAGLLLAHNQSVSVALVQIAGAGKRPVLCCRDFKLGARHSTLQTQVGLGHPDVPVRIVPCGCDASIRYRRS